MKNALKYFACSFQIIVKLIFLLGFLYCTEWKQKKTTSQSCVCKKNVCFVFFAV